MPAVADFRGYAFDPARVDSCGKYLGRKVYAQLYAIENLVRVVVHSVLTAQISPNWWTVAVDPDTQKEIAKLKARYLKTPWHGSPGAHELYYTFLSDLNPIITANAHLFRPLIPDIDTWIGRIEQIRVPRNIVGHMNWPTATDRARIDVFYSDFQHLVKKLAAVPTLKLVIP